MEYQLKGDYFNNEFHQIKRTGTTGADQVIQKFSPANLDHHLWDLNVYLKHIEPVVESSYAGHREWRRTSIDERRNYLNRYKEILLTKKEDIAKAIALETGKPLWETLTEAAALISKVDVTLNHSLPRIDNEHIEAIAADTNGHVYHKPLGPCLIIGPFNFPCHLANGQILSALIAGNSIIFKPSEKTAYSAQLMVECFVEAGFPNGVINLIQGGGQTAARLIKEKAVKGIFFTGSKEVGHKILEATHKDLSKLVALELGGKNCTILHEDANLAHAEAELIKSCFLTSGQRCTSTSIVAVHKNILPSFLERFHKLTKSLIVDHPIDFDNEPFMGPLIDQNSVDNYLTYMGMAKREGTEEIMRGKVLEKKFKGHYVSPSIHLMEKAEQSSHFLTSELFAPNAIFVPYDDFEEAVEIANITNYGLAFSIFSEQKSYYEKCLQEVESGIINWNRSTVGAHSRLPFGGIKNSGNYHPAAVTTIDACVYKMSSLEYLGEPQTIESIKGLSL